MTSLVLGWLLLFAAAAWLDRRARARRRRQQDETMRQHLAGARPWWGDR